MDILPEEQKVALQNATDNQELEQIISIFNQNLKKKELLRVGKLSDLQDAITDQVEKRLKLHADEFSNKDLIDYFKAFQDTIQKTDSSIDSIPQIAITQNQLNINVQSEFNQDERQRIMNAVRQIIAQSNSQVQEEAQEQLEVINENQ